MKNINLSNGGISVVDDEDYERVKHIPWYRFDGKTTSYVAAKIKNKNGEWVTERLHRFLISPDPHQVVDHIDGDGLNNQKSNLRICLQSQNTKNCSLYKTSTTGYKGVTKKIVRGIVKWSARIQVDKKRLSLGLFTSPEEAYAAYCEASQKYHGQFGKVK